MATCCVAMLAGPAASVSTTLEGPSTTGSPAGCQRSAPTEPLCRNEDCVSCQLILAGLGGAGLYHEYISEIMLTVASLLEHRVHTVAGCPTAAGASDVNQAGLPVGSGPPIEQDQPPWVWLPELQVSPCGACSCDAESHNCVSGMSLGHAAPAAGSWGLAIVSTCCHACSQEALGPGARFAIDASADQRQAGCCWSSCRSNVHCSRAELRTKSP